MLKMPFPKFSWETLHDVLMFVTNHENTKVDPTWLRSCFHLTWILISLLMEQWLYI
jgi:hypothetical protein